MTISKLSSHQPVAQHYANTFHISQISKEDNHNLYYYVSEKPYTQELFEDASFVLYKTREHSLKPSFQTTVYNLLNAMANTPQEYNQILPQLTKFLITYLPDKNNKDNKRLFINA